MRLHDGVLLQAFPMLAILIFVTQTAAAAVPLSPATSQRTGEAYGLCIAAAAREHARVTDDMDAIMAHALGACTAEAAAAREAYLAYLRSIGMETSPEQVDRMLADGLPQLRQRIAGCLAVDRANRADGGRRMC